jgi:hypothetical protein
MAIQTKETLMRCLLRFLPCYVKKKIKITTIAGEEASRPCVCYRIVYVERALGDNLASQFRTNRHITMPRGSTCGGWTSRHIICATEFVAS